MMVELVLEAAMAQKVDVSSMDVQEPTELWEKKTFQFTGAACLWQKSYEPFFFHNYLFFHNSVGDCMSIDSQFECILRGNIEL